MFGIEHHTRLCKQDAAIRNWDASIYYVYDNMGYCMLHVHSLSGCLNGDNPLCKTPTAACKIPRDHPAPGGNLTAKNTPLTPLLAFFTSGVEHRAYFGSTELHLGNKSALVVMQGGNEAVKEAGRGGRAQLSVCFGSGLV